MSRAPQKPGAALDAKLRARRAPHTAQKSAARRSAERIPAPEVALAYIATMRAEIGRLTQANADFGVQLEAVSAERDQARAQFEAQARAIQDLENLAAEREAHFEVALKIAEGEIKTLQAQAESLDEARAASQALQDDLSAAAAKLATERAKVEALWRTLGERAERIKDLTGQVEEATTRADRYRAAFEGLSLRLGALELFRSLREDQDARARGAAEADLGVFPGVGA